MWTLSKVHFLENLLVEVSFLLQIRNQQTWFYLLSKYLVHSVAQNKNGVETIPSVIAIQGPSIFLMARVREAMLDSQDHLSLILVQDPFHFAATVVQYIDYQVRYLNHYQRNCNLISTVMIPIEEHQMVKVSYVISIVWPNASQKSFLSLIDY
jgi:hypothetical protein